MNELYLRLSVMKFNQKNKNKRTRKKYHNIFMANWNWSDISSLKKGSWKMKKENFKQKEWNEKIDHWECRKYEEGKAISFKSFSTSFIFQ